MVARGEGLFYKGKPIMKDQFRRVLLTAIGDSDLRPMQKTRMRMWVWFNPHRLPDLEKAVLREAIAQQQIPENQFLENVDWDALLAFIKELIPLIIELIGLFG